MTKWTKDNEGWVIEADRWENQDLVLAVPEMLEALEFIVRCFDPVKQDLIFSKRLAIDKAINAIAKAKRRRVMGKPHKHAELIKAFADGKMVQFQEPNRTGSIQDAHDFVDVKSLGTFDSPYYEFRIKPDRVYPISSLRDDELKEIWKTENYAAAVTALRIIANASLPQFCISPTINRNDADFLQKQLAKQGLI